MNVETMGGRRSRYWCGPGLVRETKTAVPPDRNQAGGALQLFLVHATSSRVLLKGERKGIALPRQSATETKRTMAAKNTLKYKRNKLPPLLDIVNDLLEVCLRAIRSPSFKSTVSDLIQLIRLRRKLEPPEPCPTTARWIDRSVPT